MDDNTNPTEQLPKSIGRFQVVSALGYGAMGAVYKAFDPLIKRTLAIKTIRLDVPRTSPQYKSFIERFHHEARISGTLSHPNIVTLFDIGEDGGLPYLAMEYIEGQTVSSMLETGYKFKPERVIALASQVASALDYAHGRGVIHRDIKPSNLMIYGEDRVKVTDFGIAKLADADMTQSGTLLGTPSYMSPEQAMGDKLDGRSDIFSLGVCCFEMLSGEQPFPGVNVTSILYKLVHVDPIEPANLEMHGLVPQRWHDVFGKVLAKKPEERYQTAMVFVQELEFCLGSWFGGVGDLEPLALPGADGTSMARVDPPLTTEEMPAYSEAQPAAPSKAAAEVGSDTVPPRLAQAAPPASAPCVVAPTGEEQALLSRGGLAGPEDSATVAFRALIPELPEAVLEAPPVLLSHPQTGLGEGTVAIHAFSSTATPRLPEASQATSSTPTRSATPPDDTDEGTVVFAAPSVADLPRLRRQGPRRPRRCPRRLP
jgi:hypothetical protein